MAKTKNWEQVRLINELTQGKELAKQLWSHLLSSSSSHETNEVLVKKILSSYEKVLEMLNWETNFVDPNNNIGRNLDSNCSSANKSPRSEVLDQDNSQKDVSKKRKIMPTRTEQVMICTVTGLEGSLDDGYGWRKYGQKDILGAKFPRGYYRCTHRNVQGCLATKQVQRSDEDPTIFEVTYRGRHTCTQSSHLNKTFPSKRKKGLEENQFHNHQENQAREEKTEQNPNPFFTFGSGIEVKVEDMDHKEDIFPTFCFASDPSIGSDNGDNNVLNEPMMENHFMENFSPAFISPATSESNLFCLSPCHLGSNGLGQNFQTSESDLTEIISTPTSATNSPILDFEVLLDKVNFESNFPIDTMAYFS